MGRTATTPGRAVSRKASLKLLLERIDQMRRSHWENLLRLQQEQLDLLTSLIAAKTLSPNSAGLDPPALAQHRNARERTDLPRHANAPMPSTIRRG
jgi:hypothetical protein